MGIFSRGSDKNNSATPSGETAPAPAPLVRNTLVQGSLESWAQAKNMRTMAEVLRQCATGELLLDATGSSWQDPSRGFQPGDTLTIRFQTDNAGKRLLLAFTSNDRLALQYPDTEVMSLAQPATAVLAQAMTEYDGIAIDAGSGDTVCIAYAAEIRQGLTDDPAINEPLKTALVQHRAAADVLALAADAPIVFIAMGESRNEAGESTGVFVPNVTGPAGEIYSTAFTSPAEVWAWDASLTARPTGFSNIAEVAVREGHQGLVINPAGGSALIPAADFGALR